MNEDFEKGNINHYEGNGWSKYQLMVLQQLEDHNKVLQNLNKEIVDIKQMIAVSETELKMWRAQIMSSVNSLTDDIDTILYDEKGLANKVHNIEREMDVEEQASTKLKSMWALYGAIVISLINIAAQFFQSFFKNEFR